MKVPLSRLRRIYGCSEIVLTILDRTFAISDLLSEQGSHMLAGGLAPRGEICGQLWGALMAAGAYTNKQIGTKGEELVNAVALRAGSRLCTEFSDPAGSVDCRDVCGIDLNERWGMLRYILSGKLYGCAKLVKGITHLALPCRERGYVRAPYLVCLRH